MDFSWNIKVIDVFGAALAGHIAMRNKMDPLHPYRNRLLHGNCIEIMREMPANSVDLIFADPPFNIGLEGYDVYVDKKPYEEYYNWSADWINECYRICAEDGSIYIAIGDEFAAELNILLKKAGFIFRNWIVWHFTFGQNTRSKFARCHTHILYFTKHRKNFKFNKEDILIPSARQLVYGDKRAKSGGKVPDDVWPVYADAGGLSHELAVYPQDWEIWNDSRVCGTFKERLLKPDGSAHPCQMPLSVLRRIISASSNKGDLVLDPFCGTGTTAVAAQELGRQYCSMDISEDYVRLTQSRLNNDAQEKAD